MTGESRPASLGVPDPQPLHRRRLLGGLNVPGHALDLSPASVGVARRRTDYEGASREKPPASVGIARRRAEAERAEAFFPLRATTK
jgi:hypothetical protein